MAKPSSVAADEQRASDASVLSHEEAPPYTLSIGHKPLSNDEDYAISLGDASSAVDHLGLPGLLEAQNPTPPRLAQAYDTYGRCTDSQDTLSHQLSQPLPLRPALDDFEQTRSMSVADTTAHDVTIHGTHQKYQSLQFDQDYIQTFNQETNVPGTTSSQMDSSDAFKAQNPTSPEMSFLSSPPGTPRPTRAYDTYGPYMARDSQDAILHRQSHPLPFELRSTLDQGESGRFIGDTTARGPERRHHAYRDFGRNSTWASKADAKDMPQNTLKTALFKLPPHVALDSRDHDLGTSLKRKAIYKPTTLPFSARPATVALAKKSLPSRLWTTSPLELEFPPPSQATRRSPRHSETLHPSLFPPEPPLKRFRSLPFDDNDVGGHQHTDDVHQFCMGNDLSDPHTSYPSLHLHDRQGPASESRVAKDQSGRHKKRGGVRATKAEAMRGRRWWRNE